MIHGTHILLAISSSLPDAKMHPSKCNTFEIGKLKASWPVHIYQTLATSSAGKNLPDSKGIITDAIS